MTPTSPLGGVLTGLIAGLVIAVVVVAVVWVVNHRRAAAAARAIATDEIVRTPRLDDEAEPVDLRKVA